MMELPLSYWNQLANQIVLICALMSGFSLTVLIRFLDRTQSSRLMKAMFWLATMATGSFLVSIFAMTKILMMTTEGFPFPVTESELGFPRLIGFLAFLIGIISVLAIISLAGWTQSKKLGRLTTVVGAISFVIMMFMMT